MKIKKLLEEENYNKLLSLSKKNIKEIDKNIPEYEGIYFYLGKISQRKTQNLDDAIFFFEKQTEKNNSYPFDYYSYLSMQEIYLTNRNHSAGFEVAEKALHKFGNKKEIIDFVISTYLNAHKIMEARELLDKNKKILGQNDSMFFEALISLSESSSKNLDARIKKNIISYIENVKFESRIKELVYEFIKRADLQIEDQFISNFKNLYDETFKKEPLFFLVYSYFLYAEGKYKEAISFFEEYLSLSGVEEQKNLFTSEYVLDYVYNAYVKAYLYENGINLFSKIILQMDAKLNQPLSLAYEYKSKLERIRENYKRAYEDIKKSIKYDARDENIWLLNKILFYFKSSDFKKNEGDITLYLKNIKDPKYFSDIHQKYIEKEMREGAFLKIYYFLKTGGKSISDYIRANGYFILLEANKEGLVKLSPEEVNAYKKFLKKQNSNIYYKAIYKLKDGEQLDLLELSRSDDRPSLPEDPIDKIVKGYIKINFLSSAHAIALENQNFISNETFFELAKALIDKGKYIDGLRIFDKFRYRSDLKFSKETLKYIYPLAFKKEIEKVAKEFNLEPYLFYALIRTESYFNSDISSSVGAKGLSQLMGNTASEIIRKLRINSENPLEDSYTNLRIGGYYLRYLLNYYKGNIVYALSAYNAGLGHVNKWKSEAAGKSIYMFRENIPYSETKNYISEIFIASIYYGSLYYNKKPEEVIKTFFKEN